MSRYKPVGWRGQPHRHSLAARGISTKHEYFKMKRLMPGDEATLRGVGKGKILQRNGNLLLFEHEKGGQGWFTQSKFVDTSQTFGDLFGTSKERSAEKSKDNPFAEKSKARQRLQKLAYAEPKDIEGAGGLINGVSRIGAKVIQIATVRPLEFGIRSGKGEKREQV